MSPAYNPPRKENMSVKNTVATLKDIGFASPDRVLFYGVNLSVKKGETVALTGESGVGKSTLLKIILGKNTPDTGISSLTKGVKVSYVPQDIEDIEADDNISIRDLFYKARGLDIVEGRKRELVLQLPLPKLLHERSFWQQKSGNVNKISDSN